MYAVGHLALGYLTGNATDKLLNLHYSRLKPGGLGCELVHGGLLGSVSLFLLVQGSPVFSLAVLDVEPYGLALVVHPTDLLEVPPLQKPSPHSFPFTLSQHSSRILLELASFSLPHHLCYTVVLTSPHKHMYTVRTKG